MKEIRLVARKSDFDAMSIIAAVDVLIEKSVLNDVGTMLLDDNQKPDSSDILIFTSSKPVGGCSIGHNLVVTSANGQNLGTKRLIAISKGSKTRKEPMPLENVLQSLVRIARETCSSRGDYCFLWGIVPLDSSAIGSPERISTGEKKKNRGMDDIFIFPSLLPADTERRSGW